MKVVSATKKKGIPTYRERLEKLSKKRIAIIFDECHRSQFGDNHKLIKDFFPKAQLFGFTGTPIKEENSIYKKVDGTVGFYVTTKDVFEKELHAYTITHAIEDRNVLRFHVDYFTYDDKGKVAKITEKARKKRSQSRYYQSIMPPRTTGGTMLFSQPLR